MLIAHPTHFEGFDHTLLDKPELTVSTRPEGPKRAWLLGVKRRNMTQSEVQEHLDELASLVKTMGIEVAGMEIASISAMNAAYLVGAGKAEEVMKTAEMEQCEVLVVDDDMSPAQQRNWEELGKVAVIDRREVILDIFRQRARTNEARMQVELARLEYSLPRLKRAWTHLERQRGGGSFTGGAGEAQIEVDRRMVRDHIARLKREIKQVRQQRATQRKGRHRRPHPTAAIVGYTNSGKSTMLNKLTGSDVLAEDKLFATLDPTTRRITLPNNQQLLLTDTVGFIRKLPHMLVDAFMATLEEAQVAEFLVHVVDASHPQAMEHLEVTNKVLADLDTEDKPRLYVLNKADQITDQMALAALCEVASPYVITSLHTGEGVADLVARLAEYTGRELITVHLMLPHSRADLLAFLHREGQIVGEKHTETGVEVEVRLAPKHHWRVDEFRATPAE